MNTKEELRKFLQSKPGYLKKGASNLYNTLRIRWVEAPSIDDCAEVLAELRLEQKQLKSNFESNLKQKILIYDIETSYNIGKFWRTGYNLNINPQDIIQERAIICISYKWVGEDKIYNMAWDNNQSDKFLLEQFIEVLNEADLIVAHNGDRYDLKFIKTRALKHGLPMYLNYPSVDTLKLAKRKFMFNSNKLDYIAEYLGFGNKIKTDMSLWDDIILRKSDEAMRKMIEYCDMDVELLEKVYLKLVGWDKSKLHFGVMNGGPTYSSPVNGSVDLELVKTTTTPAGTKKRIMRDMRTGGTFEMSDTNYKKFLKDKE